jgi:hypothetical protein
MRALSIVLASLGCATAMAACGSSKHNSSASSRGSWLAFAQCMRGHGVPNLPDPSGQGGGFQIPDSVNPASPAFQAAQAACKKLMPGGGPPAHATQQQRQQLVAVAQCMRGHGVPGFPDPTTRSTPPANPQDYSFAEGIGDVWLLVPITINPNSPAFTKAAKSCHFH